MAPPLFQILSLLSCTIAAAFASSRLQDGVAFSVPQIRTNAPPRSIILDKQKAASRYGDLAGLAGNVRERRSLHSRGHRVSAYPLQYESAYVCPVEIGGQAVYLDFDTGSSDLWVMSSLLSKGQVGNHSVYNPALSDSSRLLSDSTWNVTYGDNTAAGGVVYRDNVNVGGAVVLGQAVQAANMVSKTWTAHRDGILGLAADSLSNIKPQKQNTFFTNLAPSLRSKVFTAHLGKGKPGSFDFGYVDRAKYRGALSYVPVKATSGLWQFAAGGYAIGDSALGSETLGTTFLDTGSSLTYLPKTLIEPYYKQVQNATYDSSHGGFVFPCAALLPNLTLQLGGNHITMHGLLINYAPVRIGAETCLGGIQESPAPGISIFGDTFFKASFVVFDKNDEHAPRIGFAQQR